MRIKLAESDNIIVGRTSWWLGLHRRYRLYSSTGWLCNQPFLSATDLPWLSSMYHRRSGQYAELVAWDIMGAADRLAAALETSRKVEVEVGRAGICVHRYGSRILNASVVFRKGCVLYKGYVGEVNADDTSDQSMQELVITLMGKVVRHLGEQVEIEAKKVEQLCCLAMSADNRLRMRKAKEKINDCDKDE